MPLRPWQINQDRAHPAIGYILITGGGTADTDQVGISGRIYEFDTNAAITGDVKVDVSGGANPAQSITALVAAINADAARTVDAVDIGGAVCALVKRTAGVNVTAITNPVDAGGTIDISSAAFTSGQAESRLSLHNGNYALTAQDVTTLAVLLGTNEVVIGGFGSTTQPRIIAVSAHTAGGAHIDLTDGIFTFRQANANWWVLCYAEPAAGALLAATDVIEFLAGVTGV